MTQKDTPKPTRKPPAYRQRCGYDQAVVTLTDAATGKRRDYWLGPFGTPASREMYYRLLAEYEALGRRLPPKPSDAAGSGPGPLGVTVSELCLEYWRCVARDHLPKRAHAVRMTLRLLRRMDGSTPVAEYGPRRLRLLRDAMVSGDPAASPPRKPWCRSTVNDRVRIAVAVFRWGVTQETVPVAVADALGMVEPLRRGRSPARESRRIGPVDERLLEATMTELYGPVLAMVRLQLLTGARPGEIVALRGRDIARDGRSGLLVARPPQHKNTHRGVDRAIYFGPEAEAVVAPFLKGRDPCAPLFSPREAEAERLARKHASRVTPIGYGNRPGTNRSSAAKRALRDVYDAGSYRRAIWYACDRAFPVPPGKDPDDWRRAHRWHPNQLRHTAATRIRAAYGLEAAQLVLGHSSATITDAVYAERDETRVAEVLRHVG